MKCWHCKTELIWGGDHDLSSEDNEVYSMVTNLSCPTCNSVVDVYFPRESDEDSYVEVTLPPCDSE